MLKRREYSIIIYHSN